jgi:hypothetical protein
VVAEQVPELELTRGPGAGQRFRLDKKKTRIGRSNENEIIINDRMSSRVHSIIREVDGVFYLQDQESRNGTKLNGRAIEEEELHHGDEIRIGDTAFRVIFPGGGTAPPARVDDREFAESDFADIEEEYDESLEKSFDWKIFIILPIALLAILIVYFYLSQEDKDIPMAVIPLPAPLAYGFIPNGDQKHADKVVYSFEAKDTNLFLHYKVWDVDKKGEVNLYLNREKIEELEPTGSGNWSGLRRLKLPVELIHLDKKNILVFDNPLNPPGMQMWGVADVEIKSEESFECDVQKAKQAYELGKKSYEDKLVIQSNLYRAIEKFNEADGYQKNCPEKPEFFLDNKLKLDEATRELNNVYRDHFFEYNKNKKLRRYEQAEIELRFLKELIPNPNDERHIEIKREERNLRELFRQR